MYVCVCMFSVCRFCFVLSSPFFISIFCCWHTKQERYRQSGLLWAAVMCLNSQSELWAIVIFIWFKMSRHVNCTLLRCHCWCSKFVPFLLSLLLNAEFFFSLNSSECHIYILFRIIEDTVHYIVYKRQARSMISSIHSITHTNETT